MLSCTLQGENILFLMCYSLVSHKTIKDIFIATIPSGKSIIEIIASSRNTLGIKALALITQQNKSHQNWEDDTEMVDKLINFTLFPSMHSLPIIIIACQNRSLIMVDKLTRTHNQPRPGPILEFTLSVMHPMGLDKKQMTCIYCYRIIQNCFMVLKSCLLLHPFPSPALENN